MPSQGCNKNICNSRVSSLCPRSAFLLKSIFHLDTEQVGLSLPTIRCSKVNYITITFVNYYLTFSWSSVPSLLSLKQKLPLPASSFLYEENGCSQLLQKQNTEMHRSGISSLHTFKFPLSKRCCPSAPISQNAATSSFFPCKEIPASIDISVLRDIFVIIFLLNSGDLTPFVVLHYCLFGCFV